MGDLAALKARIADELDRTDLTSQIALAIATAISNHSQERYWFNEDTDTFSTSAGTEYYAIDPTNTVFDNGMVFREIQALTLIVNNNRTPVYVHTWKELNDKIHSITAQGYPIQYAIFSQQIRLYPRPSGVYQLQAYGTTDIPAPAADNLSNFWTVEAEKMIREEAKAIICADVILDDAGANKYYALAGKARTNLVDNTIALAGTHEVRRHFW